MPKPLLAHLFPGLLWLSLFPFLAHAQQPTWQAAVTVTAATPTDYSQVTATATDGANVYIAGNFSGTVRFGSTMLTSAGFSNPFVAKWDTNTHQFSWALQGGGTQGGRATALAVNGANIYLAGDFFGATAPFGNLTLSKTTSPPDPFVAKLTDGGQQASFTWAKRVGGNRDDYAGALAVQGNNVYFAGTFASPTADFGSLTLTTINSTAGSANAFLTKLTDTGSSATFNWAQRVGGTGTDFGQAVAVSGTNIYLAGHSTSPSVGTALSHGDTDALLAKFTDAGSTASLNWAMLLGGAGSDAARAVAVQGQNIYMAGIFNGTTVSFGPYSLLNAGLNTSDAFVVKLADTGSSAAVRWAQRAGGSGWDGANALAVNRTHVYVSGNLVNFTAALGTTQLISAGGSDAFVAKLADDTGQFVWAQQAGGPGDDSSQALAVDNNASLYVAGTLLPPATVGSQVLTGAAAGSGFVAELTDNTRVLAAASAQRSDINLFPNPVRGGHFTVITEIPTGPMTLTDAQGRVVRRWVPTARTRLVLETGGLAPGVYTLQWVEKRQTQTKRVVLEVADE
jgi:hypothetical protein